MIPKRLNDRVEVALPIVCKLEEKNTPLEMQGHVENLSINGMKISVPLPLAAITSKLMDFVLELPKPFNKIRGHAEIQWKRWDSKKKRTAFGLKLSVLSIKHLIDLDAIVTEIQEDSKLR